MCGALTVYRELHPVWDTAQRQLSLGILIRIDEQHSGQVMKELLFKTTELGVQIGFEPLPSLSREVLTFSPFLQH